MELYETPNLVDTFPLDREAWGKYSDDFVKYSSEAKPENMVKLINQYLKNLKEGNTSPPEERENGWDDMVHIAVWYFCKEVSEEGSVDCGFLEYLDSPQDYQVVKVHVDMEVIGPEHFSEEE